MKPFKKVIGVCVHCYVCCEAGCCALLYRVRSTKRWGGGGSGVLRISMAVAVSARLKC